MQIKKNIKRKRIPPLCIYIDGNILYILYPCPLIVITCTKYMCLFWLMLNRILDPFLLPLFCLYRCL